MPKTDGLTTFKIGIELDTVNCAECGILFAVSSEWISRRRNDHRTFYCPAGHHNYFGAKSREDQLRDELAKTRESVEYYRKATARLEDDKTKLKHRVRAQKGVATRLRNKAIAGICAFCSCEFPNVAEHVRAEHPGEALEEDPE